MFALTMSVQSLTFTILSFSSIYKSGNVFLSGSFPTYVSHHIITSSPLPTLPSIKFSLNTNLKLLNEFHLLPIPSNQN
ncbi:hypothetical protein HanIR_Chr15g0738981 [Helianthus annuus]|nr:hypothetical protein HanIR_Chr15g0738981 [Helianthus annuus]